MPFGVASAPEIFQKRNQKLFGDIEGVEIYFDDIIVAGNDEASHDAIMSKVLERARSVNIKFNADKLQYRVSEVKYVGQIISKSGIKPDPDHIKAIVEMPTPKSKTEVRRLLGMINFLSKFIPNVSKVTAPLIEIIHENVGFNWGKEQEMSFENIKELLTKTPILKVFSANDEIVIQCDSSKDGLGSCLIQKGQPVSFVSRNLTKSEKNYAQIEKELLKKFANDWDFNYAFISPHYSPSNGMVERAVGIAKGNMRKAKEDRKDHFVGLMEYRNTAISGLNLSPAQTMFNRRVKTKLPISNKLLNAELFNNIREKLIMRQNIQKFYYDKTAHPLSELKQKENIRILNFKNKTWEPAEIVSKHKLHPRSYFVKDQFGKILRRNRKHIRKSNTPFNIETDPNDEIINTSQSDSEVPLNSQTFNRSD
ncbi:Retrovirus-related Pol polyprotein from transposon 17.6 [Araneus ventricosus]|uniref:Retrovirus-related Pol polyprotein from transposon 17.6 n=1 Tax=Araneus ventricosus TaxID=182803 RepID=A0A4Y2NIG0_ARAVE|nr:Retrovirus-related Pol polyprotein from transposon 17.6 [Araneus ventricosus]